MAPKIKFEVEGYECSRCNHRWIPRTKIEDEPTICPQCKSPYWNKPRRIDLAKNEVEQARKAMKLKNSRRNGDL